jgi:hypothetical protein
VRGRLCRDQTCANKEHDTVVVSDHGSGQALALVSGTLDRLHSATQYTYVHATRINEFKSATERSECSEHEARRRGSRRPVDLRLKDVNTLQTRSPRGMIAYFAFPGRSVGTLGHDHGGTVHPGREPRRLSTGLVRWSLTCQIAPDVSQRPEVDARTKMQLQISKVRK